VLEVVVDERLQSARARLASETRAGRERPAWFTSESIRRLFLQRQGVRDQDEIKPEVKAASPESEAVFCLVASRRRGWFAIRSKDGLR